MAEIPFTSLPRKETHLPCQVWVSDGTTTTTAITRNTGEGADVRTANLGPVTLTVIGGDFINLLHRLQASNQNRIQRLEQKTHNARELEKKLSSLKEVAEKQFAKESAVSLAKTSLKDHITLLKEKNEHEIHTEELLCLSRLLYEFQELDPPREINPKTTARYLAAADQLLAKTPAKNVQAITEKTAQAFEIALPEDPFQQRQQFMQKLREEKEAYREDSILLKRVENLYAYLEKIRWDADEALWNSSYLSVKKEMEEIRELTLAEAKLKHVLEDASSKVKVDLGSEEWKLLLQKRCSLASSEDVRFLTAKIQQMTIDCVAEKVREESKELAKTDPSID